MNEWNGCCEKMVCYISISLVCAVACEVDAVTFYLFILFLHLLFLYNGIFILLI